MAKIEKPAALEQIDDIIRLSDAIMVARGDLGVEIPHEDVPGRQKELIGMPPGREAGDRGNADAGLHDYGADADPRGSIRCRHRHL